MKRTLSHVLWIGGGTGAGKTTVATLLAGRHGLRPYHYDRAEPEQIARMTPACQPRFTRFAGLTIDERWIDPTPEALAAMTLGMQDERFGLVIEDLVALPSSAVVLAEGFGLRPDLVAPHLDDPRQAVWLLPTPVFRERALEAAGRLWSMPRETSDPPRALANRLERDGLLTEHTRDVAHARGLAVIDVDGTLGVDALAAAVEQQFAPWW